MAVELPPRIRCFIDNVVATLLDNIDEPLTSFVWDFDEGDFHHWVDLFNHFDSYFEKTIKPRRDLQLEDVIMVCDSPLPRKGIIQALRVIRIILENCSNKHFYSSYEEHFLLLLNCTDADVVEGCLQTLAVHLKMPRNNSSTKTTCKQLLAFSQGWGPKDIGLGLVVCAGQQVSDPVAYELGCTLHFEFYLSDSSEECTGKKESSQGLHVIHVPCVNGCQETDLELLTRLVKEHEVPSNLRFSLLTRLRFARAFGSWPTRQQYTRIRLYAFVALAQASGNADLLVTFFKTEPAFLHDLVTLFSSEYPFPEDIRNLCVISLVALCQSRFYLPSVLASVTSGGHRGVLSVLMHRAVISVMKNTSEWSVVFAESLLSLVTVLVSSSSGCSAMRESEFIPILLPLLKSTDPQHLHLVSTAVHVLEALMDNFNPDAALFRDLGGLDETISRLKFEVCNIQISAKRREDGPKPEGESSELASSSHKKYRIPSLYSEDSHRRSLVKVLLRAIIVGTYDTESNSRVYGSKESLLLQCLCTIFQRAKQFGGRVFSLAATVMNLILQDPARYPLLEAAGLPSTFMDAIMDDFLCSAEAIKSIPRSLGAICLNNNGLEAVKDRSTLRCFVKIFTSEAYLCVLSTAVTGSLSARLDQLMCHVSVLCAPCVNMLIEILNEIAKMGSIHESFTISTDSNWCSTAVPMETNADERKVVLSDGEEILLKRTCDETFGFSDVSSNTLESILPDFIDNIARLLKTVLRNSEMCRIFVEENGIEALLQIFTLRLVPLSSRIGQSISVAFKNFDPQHYVSLARLICTFFRDHLKSTNEIMQSIGGTSISLIEVSNRATVLKTLSAREGILCLLNSLLKGKFYVVVAPELGAADFEIIKEIGTTYREVLWQISICQDSKMDEKKLHNSEPESTDATIERDTGEDVRNMNPITVRSTNRDWDVHREFISSVCSESLNRGTRHGLSRDRGGRAGRHLDTLNIDSEVCVDVPETTSHDSISNKNPDAPVLELLNKLASAMRAFLTSLVKGFMVPNRRRRETGSLSSSSKSIGVAIAQIFYDCLNFQAHALTPCQESLMSVKCRYLGKVVDDLTGSTVDSRKRTCYAAMANYFYVHGTFKELLTTFAATSQLLWTLSSIPIGADREMSSQEGKLSHNSWLLDALQSYCIALDNFVKSAVILAPSVSHSQLLVQPASSRLSIGLLPVPQKPEAFVKMLQLQVLDVVLPVWNHPMFSHCSEVLITSITSLITHIYRDVGEGNPNRSTDAVQEDEKLAGALAWSLVNESETYKSDSTVKYAELLTGVGEIPPVDDLISTSTKLLLSNAGLVFTLRDLFVTICCKNKGEYRSRVISHLVQQLRLSSSTSCSKDTNAVCSISHFLALLISEDGNARKFVAENGFTSIATDMLTCLKVRSESSNEGLTPKCASSLLNILDFLLQSTRTFPSETTEGDQVVKASNHLADRVLPVPTVLPLDLENESCKGFGKILGKSTGYLTHEECCKVLDIACDMIKQHVPAVVMHALLQLCARLTKMHSLAMRFLDDDGVAALFALPVDCIFLGYDYFASLIIRHVLEDPQTLQTAMESEIRQAQNCSGPVTPREFLTSMAPIISRDPTVFMRAVAATCQLELTEGRTLVVSKEKEKDLKIYKELRVNLAKVVNHLLDIIINDSAVLAKVAFVHKLLADILVRHEQAADTILKHDPDVCHHILHRLLPLSLDKSAGSDERKDELSEKVHCFLTVLCGRSSEGRRRVFCEIVNGLASLTNFESNPSKILLPNRKVQGFVELFHIILSKTSYSSNIVKSMIESGIVKCLSGILQVIDLDHPDAPRTTKFILKIIESLTRTYDASSQMITNDEINKNILDLNRDDEDDEDDVDDDEEEDIAEDGAGTMSLADSDIEDHDDPVLHDYHLPSSLFRDPFSGRVAPPLADYSTGLNPLHWSGGRDHAAVIARVLEQEFLDQMCSITPPVTNQSETHTENVAVQANDKSEHSEHAVSNLSSRQNTAIDPMFLESLPYSLREDLQVLASERAEIVEAPAYVPQSADYIDPEYLAALPPDIRAEVLAPSSLLIAEAQMLQDQATSHYRARER